MTPPDHLTDRLELWRPDIKRDLEDAFILMSDPRSWEHAPGLRHTSEEVTRGWLERAARRWQDDGLSYWIARSRSNRAFVGMGGVQRHVTGAWNLLYRVSVAFRGRGLAVEMGRAALIRAEQQDARPRARHRLDPAPQSRLAPHRREARTQRPGCLSRSH